MTDVSRDAHTFAAARHFLEHVSKTTERYFTVRIGNQHIPDNRLA